MIFSSVVKYSGIPERDTGVQ